MLADVPALAELVHAAYRGEAAAATWSTEADLIAGQRTDEAELRQVIGTDGSVIVQALDEAGALLGCFQLERRLDAVAYFGLFAIWPEHQGGGLGRSILAEAEQQARRRWSATVLEMSVIGQRVELIAWYERRGYRRSGERRPFPYGQPAFGLPKREDLYFEVLRKLL